MVLFYHMGIWNALIKSLLFSCDGGAVPSSIRLIGKIFRRFVFLRGAENNVGPHDNSPSGSCGFPNFQSPAHADGANPSIPTQDKAGRQQNPDSHDLLQVRPLFTPSTVSRPGARSQNRQASTPFAHIPSPGLIPAKLQSSKHSIPHYKKAAGGTKTSRRLHIGFYVRPPLISPMLDRGRQQFGRGCRSCRG